MRIALMIEGQEGVTWEQWLALARACEQHGVEAMFRSDHYSGFQTRVRRAEPSSARFSKLESRDKALAQLGRPRRVASNQPIAASLSEAGALDAWATLAALAASTQKVRLGTLVSPGTFRHPSVLARMAATVDHVSGGRVELGMGAGWYEEEHRRFGFDFHEASWRVARLGEQLEIVSRQLNGEGPFDLRGEHYALEGADALPRPVQRPLPIVVGGAAKRGTARPAARFAAEYNTTFATPDECRERRAKLDRACERARRDPATLPLSLMTQCVVGRNRAEVDDRLHRLGREPWRPEASLIGTVDEVAERLREYEEASVTRVMCQHLLHDDLDMVELLGRELAPAVA